EITPLGTGAALPARGRHPSAQLLNASEELYLIDCGEGTQERLRRIGVNFMRIGHVFISHLHGDHYLGLVGLISTMHLMGRTRVLHVHAPEGIGSIIDIQLQASRTYLRFPLKVHVLPEGSGQEVWSDRFVRVTSLALVHRIPCVGFIFKEAPLPRNLRKEKVHLIPHFMRQAVKEGADLALPDGSSLPNEELTTDPMVPRSFAYCSDTAYAPELIEHLLGVDLLYHEATFTEQMSGRAKETMHSTARQAGMIARDANVGRLLLGHFSSRYKDVDALVAEARTVFPHAQAAEEGITLPIV
ncbi:MAG: ribonuclease Z, partial [Flavobacteriales bacterium]|nr:ribonuclease Z [Flavobacteriales bacterium]